MCRQEPVQPSVISGKLLAKATLLPLRGVRFGRLDAVEFHEEPSRPIVGNRKPPNRFGDLPRHFLFAEVRLGAQSDPLGRVVRPATGGFRRQALRGDRASGSQVSGPANGTDRDRSAAGRLKAAGPAGPKLSALAAYQKGDCHMSYSTIQRFWNDVLGIPISRSQVVNVVQKPRPPSPSPMPSFARPWFRNRSSARMNPDTRTRAIGSGRGVSTPRGSRSFTSTPLAARRSSRRFSPGCV